MLADQVHTPGRAHDEIGCAAEALRKTVGESRL
jgi:hypothetical protein